MRYEHTPVLLQEVLNVLPLLPGSSVVDATLGGGGYAKAILELTAPDGLLLGIDLDHESLKNFTETIGREFEDRFTLVQGNFADIDEHIKRTNFPSPVAIVADIGLSSFQLDMAGRGISFMRDEPLDMRFSVVGNGPNAAFILEHSTVGELVEIFKEYGEERYSRSIAERIVERRTTAPVKTTFELREIIQQSLPKPVQHLWQDSCRRVFQALRIRVNHELDNLETFIPKAFDLVAPGGVLAVVSFHSLEDRIVKQMFVKLARGCVCPPEFPACICGKTPRGELITKKPIIASADELAVNRRATSAKLRAIKKTY